MLAGSSLIPRSLAGALLYTLLFTSASLSSSTQEPGRFSDEFLSAPKPSRSASLRLEPRPGFSDTFVPVVATTEEETRSRDAALTGASLARISESIHKSRIFPSGARFKLLRAGSTLALSTYKHPFGHQSDMKIDALLVAREVLKVDAAGIEAVNVYFFSPDDQSGYTMISVNLDIVKRFDGGRIAKESIIDLVKLRHEELGLRLHRLETQTYYEISSSIEPGDGILLSERAALMQQIETLKHRGINVNAMQAASLILEDAVRQNDDLSARAAYAYASELLENARLKPGVISTQ